ncbi:MAG: PorT family protein, partial [Candidatus Aminicenantes bacterium]|nr:PorT family protein [Candidatus Aminicenantes bacterium]
LPQPASADIRFGIKAGGNMARPTGADARDPLATLQSRVGFMGGVFLAVDLSRIFSIQSEVLYTMKGATYVANDDTYTDKLYADYVEVPMLLMLRIPVPVVRPFVFGGPTVGFKLQEKLISNGEEVPLTEAFFKNNDYGAIFGAGLSLGRNFMLDVRYSLGMQKVLAVFAGQQEADYKNGVWSATVGIAF